MPKEPDKSGDDFPRVLVRIKKNYRPLAQSAMIKPGVTVGDLLDAHASLRDLGAGAAAGGELVGPWYVYKEGSDDIRAAITTEQISVLVEAGVVVREVTMRELIIVGQDFSGPTLAAGGELIGPWYVLKEGSNRLETLGEVRAIELP